MRVEGMGREVGVVRTGLDRLAMTTLINLEIEVSNAPQKIYGCY